MLMLTNDINEANRLVNMAYPWFRSLSDIRQNVMVELMFILGPIRFSNFKNMVNFMSLGDYLNAAKEIRNSELAKEIGPVRTNDLASALETGNAMP